MGRSRVPARPSRQPGEHPMPAGGDARRRPPPAADGHHLIRQLQRSAGNRAATAFLARLTESERPPRPGEKPAAKLPEPPDSIYDDDGRIDVEKVRQKLEYAKAWLEAVAQDFSRPLVVIEKERLERILKNHEQSVRREAEGAWMTKGKLVYASKHPKVRELQRLLNDAGADPPLTVDQQFFDATLRAVKRFQTRNGLKPDGVVGEKTWAALGGTGRLPSVYEQQPARDQKWRREQRQFP